MLWTRRHVTAFSAVFTIAFIILVAQVRSPGAVVSLDLSPPRSSNAPLQPSPMLSHALNTPRTNLWNHANTPQTNLIKTVAKPKTAAFHLLIPASNPHLQLCRLIVSSLTMGYPVPILNGYHLTGELDAAVSHLAKVRNIMRYLDDLPPSADDDLMLIVDGYDVVMTLPVDIMIKRYFEVVNDGNAKLEERFGEGSTRDVPGGRGDQPRQTILFGADKICWPVDWRRPACWAVPSDTGIPLGAFGHEDGNMWHNQPRWLNSGTIMGPVGDMRLMIAGTLERIRVGYDEHYQFRESDQKYMSDVWADQEYMRSVRELKHKGQVPVEGGEPVPAGGPKDRVMPVLAPRQRTEYHIAMEYESALFQTRAGNDQFTGMPTFSGPGYTTLVQNNFNRRPSFLPYEIRLPTDVVSSITRMFKSIADLQELPNQPAEMIRHLHLGTNLVTKRVYALFHCTGDKNYLNEYWPSVWFFPYARALLRSAIRDATKGRPLSEELIDGRIWTMAHTYPASTPRGDDVGVEAAGAWADVSDGWLSWGELCASHEGAIFGGPDGKVVDEKKIEEEKKKAEEKKAAEEKKKEDEEKKMKEEEEEKKAEEEKKKAEEEKKKAEEEEKKNEAEKAVEEPKKEDKPEKDEKKSEEPEEEKKQEEAKKQGEDERKKSEEEERKKKEEAESDEEKEAEKKAAVKNKHIQNPAD